MEVFECKYCKSKNLMLESRVSGENVMTANIVALKCADCGKWIKWCPKEDRHLYIKEKEKTFTFTQEQLDQHDAEVRNNDTQGTIYKECFWGDYEFNKKEKIAVPNSLFDEALLSISKQKDQRIAELESEVVRLKTELAELKQNAIVPKFKVGDMVYVIRKIKQDIRKGKIKSTWKGSHIDNFIRFKIYINGANDVTKQESELFATLAEAEEALKKLEE